MKKIILSLLFVALISPYIAQGSNYKPELNQVVKPDDGIKSMFNNEQYAEVVERYANAPRSLSAEELTYVARAYYHLEDLVNAQRYIDMAVRKDAKYAPAYYAKGIIYNAENNFTQATGSLKKAIELSPRQSDYYSALGDAYFAQENLPEALTNYQKATKQNSPSEKAYYMIGAIYAAQDSVQMSLNAFYQAKSKIIKDKELYVTTLYNIATMESDLGHYQKAVDTYLELVDHFPDDYYTMEKIVQIYNHLGQYSRADVYKSKLYTAHQRGELITTSLSDKFCMDHFTVGKKYVLGYERYEKPSCQPFVKDIFYVTNEIGDVDSSIFLEYVPAANESEKGLYKPVMIKGTDRYVYSVLFDEDVKYATIQPYIVEMIEGKVKGELSVE
ncbi:MAG: tetratricopeptide repeat protein [Dysgonomonas sp.]|nr:tetratricopeptide repeat protein [Dysgonomonas sp.]